MLGIGKKKPQTQKINPALGVGARVIKVISALIVIASIQGGTNAIGGAVGGGIGGGLGAVVAMIFYSMAIRLLAKYRGVSLSNLMVDLTSEDRDKLKKESEGRRKFWVRFLIGCGIFLFAMILFVKLTGT